MYINVCINVYSVVDKPMLCWLSFNNTQKYFWFKVQNFQSPPIPGVYKLRPTNKGKMINDEFYNNSELFGFIL